MAGSVQRNARFVFVLALFTLTASFDASRTTRVYEGEWWCEALPGVSLFGRWKCGGTAELALSINRDFKAKPWQGVRGYLYLKEGRKELIQPVFGSYNVKKKQANLWMMGHRFALVDLLHMQTSLRQHSNAYKYIEKARHLYGNQSCYGSVKWSRSEAVVASLRAHNARETLRLRVTRFFDLGNSRERYGNFVAIVYLVQIVVVIYQITAVKNAEQSLRISLVSVALLGYYTLELAMNREMKFPKVVMYVCSAAYLILIIRLMKLRRPTGSSLSETLTKAAKVVAALVVGFVAFYYAIQRFLSVNRYLNVLVQFSFFLPQIYRDYTKGAWVAALHPAFIVVTALTTVAVPIYFFLDAPDLFGIPASPTYAVVCTLYVVAQAAYLLWRHVRAKRNPEYTEIPSSV